MENWLLLGDIHGEIGPIEWFYNQNKKRLDTCKNNIILLGDVGLNFSLKGKHDQKIKEALSKFPFTYICLRGNHESRVKNVIDKNPDKWEVVSKYSGKVYIEKEYPNIEYLEDSVSVYEFAGYKTLSIPGAYSVDKWYRLSNHLTWFEDEQLTEGEMEQGRKLIDNQSFDLVISHTCPLMYEPTDLFLPFIDQSRVDKTMERYLGEIEYNLDYKRWCFGHFHANRLYPNYNGKQALMLFNTKVVDLNKFMKMSEMDSLEDIVY